EEVREIIANCYRKAKRELEAHKEELKRLVDALLERRVLEGEDIKRAIEDQLPPLSPEDRPLI
ncbi:MAG: hypothetical protein HYS57_00990, partial [Parcubacteria group bacterium]|nr:hypothetical protein [Parcubacteria group bacterium]